ncbi:hypothetical protein [Sphingomonas xinjiangensis]|uniref:Uncharacterized protein n=1 Tax=Sphingomonas xinjiangensis TaxID=643568 RepID=A0A840YEL1_9SPHN|nr:hypothetical protein [Sphingomonas xinjiangensis]MBB5711274.1 hypothetical protein [Sphingomonas xinjiangensis]
MSRIVARLCLLTLPLVAAACAERVKPPVAPPFMALPPMPGPKPTPPASSAPNLVLPPKLADGSYATPNRSLSGAGTVWHFRVALNVAALGCDDAAHSVANAYNSLIRTRSARFDESYKALTTQYGSLNTLDVAMTRLYNYFAQPPAQPGFCAAARQVLAEVPAVPDAEFPVFAAKAMQRLEQPFLDFYGAYEKYLADLARWANAFGKVQVTTGYVRVEELTPPPEPVAPAAPTAPVQAPEIRP